MVIAFTCHGCAKMFSVKDEFAGRQTVCPKCQTVLLVPIRIAVPPAIPVDLLGLVTPASPVNAAVKMPVPKLMSCSACGQQIATTALACPKCGAPNNWLHPEIERFRASLGQFNEMPPFNIKWDRFVLRGTAEVKRGAHLFGDIGVKAIAVGLLFMLLGAFLPGTLGILVPWIVGPLCFFGGVVLMLISMLGNDQATDFVVTFVVDFSQSPPIWQSDDDDFWKNVKKFFLLDPS